MATAGTQIGERNPGFAGRAAPLVRLVALAGIPAISIPCGLAPPPRGDRPLPVGLQLAGRPFSENALLGASFALEQALGFDGSAVRA